MFHSFFHKHELFRKKKEVNGKEVSFKEKKKCFKQQKIRNETNISLLLVITMMIYPGSGNSKIYFSLHKGATY